MEGKIINFRSAIKLSGTGTVYSVFGNHWHIIWNSLIAWPGWPSPAIFYDRSTPLHVRTQM